MKRTLTAALAAFALAGAAAPADAHVGVLTAASAGTVLHVDRAPAHPMRLDVAPPKVRAQANVAPLPGRWCGTRNGAADTPGPGDGRPTVRVVYAHVAGQPDRFVTAANYLQDTVGEISRYVAAASGGRRTVRFDLGTSCGPGYLDIADVTLPVDFAGVKSADFFAAKAAIAAQLPAAAGPSNVLVLADGLRNDQVSNGQGQVLDDSSPGPENKHNSGGLYAIWWSPRRPAGFDSATYDGEPSGAFILAHELFHTLGAVQHAAPHATPYSHCTDEADLMCYEDGPGVSVQQTCPATGAALNLLDCNGDDYFNAQPPAGSWLASNWNTYNSAFLGDCAELAASCAPKQRPAPSVDEHRAFGVLADGRPAGRKAATVTLTRRVRGNRATVRLTSGPVRLPAGRWQLTSCVWASSGPSKTPRGCRRRTVTGGIARTLPVSSLRLRWDRELRVHAYASARRVAGGPARTLGIWGGRRLELTVPAP